MPPEPLGSFTNDQLLVRVYGSEEELAQAAADLVDEHLGSAVEERGAANLILATGTSQFEFLNELARREIDWRRVTVFHLDEYTELSADHPASFRRYLKERILETVRPGRVHLIDGSANDLGKEIERYASLLRQHPVDIACIGIGENGHIAFNDPPVADFEDPVWVKEVELDERCRMQQVNEEWFPSLDDAPRRAITLTIPAIMSSRAISCVVPGARKAEAVHHTLTWPVSTACPATILRHHPNATLFLDPSSAAQV